MRISFIIFWCLILGSGRGLAQDEDDFTQTTTALQDVLSTLQQSVEKLSTDNDQLAAKEEYVKQKILQKQTQLGQLEAQGDDLNKAAVQLQGNNPHRTQQINRLEEQNKELEDRIQKAEAGIKSIQQSLDPGYDEDQAPGAQDPVHQQQEKLKLIDMIYQSRQQQASLNESILEYQKDAPLQPVSSAMVRQQLLRERIKDLEGQVAAYSPEGAGAVQWDGTQLEQLEIELKTLVKNYSQLKDLTELMSKKAQNTQLTVSQHVEGEKLQNNIADLNRQGEGLRADLDDLRSQMVDLDKRKAHLETMIQQLQ